MARVLYWNVSNFTDEKIATVLRKRRYDGTYLADPHGTDRLRMMMTTFSDSVIPGGNFAALDFIVVVEVFSRAGNVEGNVIGTGGRRGCYTLLNELNNAMMGQWSLVPPVVTGQDGMKEAVAVYYRSDLWYFLGPQDWGQDYTQTVRNGLPNRLIPVGYPYRGGQQERRGAGQWQFLHAQPPGFIGPPAPVLFPAAANRKPWLTAFGDMANQNLLVRLMAVHPSPNRNNGPAFADQGTAALADVVEMTTRPPDANHQIDVILGDFNVDNLNAVNFQAGGPFGRLVGQGVNPVNPPYVPVLRAPNGMDPRLNSYYHTHGHPVGTARILNDDDEPDGFYPGYAYTDASIDNAFVRYRGLNPPLTHHPTILNRVSGSPYQALNPPPVPAPYGGYYELDDWMDETVDAILARAPDPYFQLNEYFRDWENYGCNYSVSDHFALLFDI